MGTKGSNTTTSTTAPSPQAQQAYDSLLTRASGVASTPYTPYSGELVAGVNQQQTSGINNINQNAGFAQPYIQQAGTYANNAAQPLSAAQIQQYQNPYTQQVVNATQQQFNQQNAVQQSGLKANEVSQGALGGSRNADASALLANQEQQAQTPVIAGLYSQGYNTALQTAEQQQQNQANAAYSLGNLGVAGQNAALSGAGAQVGAGSLQQGTQQALDTAQLQQFQTAQAFPYQQTQWLAGIDTGVGSQLGGTSTTTAPAPNPLDAVLGVGLTAAGAYFGGPAGAQAGASASKTLTSARGGGIPGFASGGDTSFSGTPYSGMGWIPGLQITQGRGAPPPPGSPNQQQQQSGLGSSQAAGAAAIGNGLWNKFGNQGISTDPAGSGLPYADSGAASGYGFDPSTGLALGAKHGGGIAGFADGGSPTFDDLWGGMPGVGSMVAAAPSAPVASAVPLPLPRPTVGYAGSDAAPIDATDVNINGGSGGLGLGSPYQPSNAAIQADAGINPHVPMGPSAGVGSAASAPAQIAGFPMSLAPPTNSGANAPAQPGGLSGFLANLPGRGSLSPAASQALMAAGLGMMASRSPFVGQAIGEGGLQGLDAYNQNIQQQFAQGQKQQETALEGRKVDLEAQRLAQSADQAAKELKLKTQQFGYLPGTDGNLQPIPGGPADPSTLRAQAMAKRVPGMDDDALHMMVQSYRAGNTGVLQGISRGVSGPDNLNRFWNMLSTDMQGEGATGGDLAAAKANFGAQSAAARNAAQRESTVSTAVNEAKGTFPLALQRSEEVPRSSFVPWNKAVQMVQSGTSSPELARFVTANQAVITAYSQAMSRTGTNSVNAQHHAEALLSTATSPEAYRAVIEQMGQEMEIAQAAPEQTRQDILSRIVGGAKPRGAGAAQGAPATPAQPSVPAGAIAHLRANPQLRADFDAKYGVGASAQYLGAP